ncbi:hypothetical protein NA56DRAFT_502202 [Hyaloscypha hepaticicola]|uniref:Uncharacterized protein n=1 Tax=Hyaloscypha hepaticicola TaxID=2082293 RepID=A0A2J6PDV3_9HELO|nr:hypothetical protein NA56DRAFT_502202 [Hyaloscypha hepaticicola]
MLISLGLFCLYLTQPNIDLRRGREAKRASKRAIVYASFCTFSVFAIRVLDSIAGCLEPPFHPLVWMLDIKSHAVRKTSGVRSS